MDRVASATGTDARRGPRYFPHGPPTRSLRAEIALVLVAFVWGSTFVLVKSALADVSTLLFLALRFSLAGSVLTIVYRRQLAGVFEPPSPGSGKRPISGSRWAGGMLAGACIFGGYMFQTFGLRHTTAAKSAFLTGLAIVLVPSLNSIVYKIPPKAPEALGVAVAVAGLAFMTLEGGDLGANPGDLLTLVGAFFFAAHIIVLGHYSPRQGFERLSVVQIATASLLSFGTCWWVEAPHIEWSPTVLFALAITGLLATAAAFTIQAWAQQHTTPTRTALIFALEPVFAGLTSFVVLGELLSGQALAGGLMILAGILLVELKPMGRQ